jgi:hypothetical protein
MLYSGPIHGKGQCELGEEGTRNRLCITIRNKSIQGQLDLDFNIKDLYVTHRLMVHLRIAVS